MDRQQSTRRSLMKWGGSVAVGTSIAGCAGQDGNTTTETETEGTTEDEDDSEDSEFPVTITQGGLATTLDPHNHSEKVIFSTLYSAYEKLLFFDREGNIQPKLATDWERIDDTRIRFTIRENVPYHNGDTLTPEDVVFSIHRMADPETGISSARQDTFSTVESAEVVDGEHAVDVTLSSVDPLIFQRFATNGVIVQKSWIQNNSDSEISSNVNGTGPYQLEEFNESVEVVFSRFDDYWGEQPPVTQVTFDSATESSTRVNKLLAGESDLIDGVPPQSMSRVQDNEDTKTTVAPTDRIEFAAMRYDVEPFSSKQFRQAMNYAIDLEAIVSEALAGLGEPLSQPTPEIWFGHNPDIETYPHDPDQAESLVEESGQAGAEITLHTTAGSRPKDFAVAEAVSNQIDNLSNVSCSVKQRDYSSLVGEITTGDIEDKPPFYTISFGGSPPDATTKMDSILSCDGLISTFCNEELDQRVQQSLETTDTEERKQLLHEANQIAHDSAPWIFLFTRYGTYGMNRAINYEPYPDENIYAYQISK